MIRPATPSDTAQIRAIARAAYAPYVPLIGQDPAPMHDDYAALVAAGDVTAMTDSHGTILGFVVARARGNAWFVENIAVAPEAAGKGLGSALLASQEDVARRLGFGEVTLYTNAAMAGNLVFYQKRGYRPFDRRVEGGFDRIWFRKTLA